MVEQLGDQFDFRIITQDRDVGEAGSYPGIEAETWTPLGKGAVYYLSPARISIPKLTSLIRSVKHDILYMNSFFDRVFTTRILAARGVGLIPPGPTILAPRGEFSAGALRYKRLRKQAYVQAFRTLIPWKSIVWQASTPLEKEDVCRALPGVRADHVRVACDLAAAPPPANESFVEREDGPLRVLFLSRITPMKNLVFVLEVLARVRVPVVLTIVGPRDDDYWRQCKPLVDSLPANLIVDVQGPVPPPEVTAVMRRHDLFFLPTQGENFGHVIHEALNAGLPVLISDRTPWSGVTEAGAGWALPLAAHEPFVEVINRYSATPAAGRAAMRRSAVEFGHAGSVDSSAYNDNVRLFMDMTANHGRGGR
jgi:glycosyltransferase involved in cell wall biosynthesis